MDAFHREAGQEIPGTGLGLAITARTLERMGGELQLLHRAGEGSGTLARATISLDGHSTDNQTAPPRLT
jgi:two-component system OmpR family sensor kinase